MPEEKSLVVASTEIEMSLPVGLKYFKAVDAMVSGVPIKRGEYFDIKVYGAQESQPAVKILRIQHDYSGGNVGKQDEIALATKDDRLQFNAECTREGEYIEYPRQLNLASMEYLGETVMTFKNLANVDGSQILINNRVRLVSRDGVWEPVRDKQDTRPPRFGKPQDQLPQSKTKGLLPGAKFAETNIGILLNAVLGLKKKKASSGVGD